MGDPREPGPATNTDLAIAMGLLVAGATLAGLLLPHETKRVQPTAPASAVAPAALDPIAR